jgi:protein-disulfide isomerase
MARSLLKGLAAACAVGCVVAIGSAPVDAEERRSELSRQQVEQIVREYLLANPEVILEAVEGLQEKRRTAGQAGQREAMAAQRAQLYGDPDSPVSGNPEGDVTVVEFFDYRCPYCKRAATAVSDLIREDGKVRVVFKELPILGPESVLAARSALAARAQGKYGAMHDALLRHSGGYDEAVIAKIAAEAGLDVARLKADMARPEIAAMFDRNVQLARSLSLTGTPAFVIGDRVVPGAVDLNTLKRLVAEARQRPD